jgi:hypothetical protein
MRGKCKSERKKENKILLIKIRLEGKRRTTHSQREKKGLKNEINRVVINIPSTGSKELCLF